jgi:DNA-binding PadR family transcriptional regulator
MTTRTTTPLDYALLGLLSQEPRSGYALRKTFATTAIGNYSGSPGAIYPALRRLERLGLIAGDVDATTELRPKKIFHVTREGRKVLRGWLMAAVDRDAVVRNLDEVMLRFAFHDVLDSPGATRRFLEELASEVDDYVGELSRQRRALPDAVPLQSRLALSAGIEQYKACARWARAAAKEFEGET